MRRALAVPGFTRLYAAIATSGLGDAVMLLVLGMWVRTLTGSNALAGATFAFTVLPALAAPVLGALVDRLPRRRVVVVGNLASATAAAPLLLVHVVGYRVVWAGMGVVILAAGLLVVLTLPDAVRAGPVAPVTDTDPHAPAPEPVVATPADAVGVAAAAAVEPAQDPAAVSETTRHQVDS